MKSLGLLISLTCLAFNLFSQAPGWTNAQQRNSKYPKSDYLSGYAEYKNQRNQPEDQFIGKLKEYAQTDLVQSVQTTIESASVMKTREEDENFSQLFMMSSVATSAMTINGLKFETYYNKKTKTGYVFAWANQNEVLKNYMATLQKIKTGIQQKLEQVNALSGQTSKQLVLLNSCFPEFRKAEEAQSIMFALNSSISEADLQLAEFSKLQTEVENTKAKLEKSTAADINEAASMLSLAIKSQVPENVKSARLVNLSYQDTKMGSTFSRRFSKTLEQKLSAVAGINIVTDISDPSQAGINDMLTGTYWKEGNALRIILVLKDTKTNQTLASAETKLSQDWLTQNQINYKPENFRQAYSNMKAFKTDEVTGGGLVADIWTNKGDQNLIYTEGDDMKLFVRVNRECYIRVIYHMADGSRVLLVDNYYISSDKVNTVYELPYEFECSEPFGVETLQLNAQTQPFDALNVTNQDGYDFINEGLNDILVTTRGFKKKTNDVLKAEKRVVITTMKQ